MDADQIRAELVEARNRFDEAAKKIVDAARGESDEDACAEWVAKGRQRMFSAFEDSVLLAAERTRDALQNWEVRESVPLNEDRSFMDACRTLLDEALNFKPDQ